MTDTQPNSAKSTIDYQVLALAALFEAAAQVEKLATTGGKDRESSRILIASLFIQNPDSAEDVYPIGLEKGLETLVQFMRQGKKNGSVCDRYVHGLLHLQKKLSKTPAMLDQIGSRLAQAEQQAEHFGAEHENVTANLASIYSDTLSTFRFRIQVLGEITYLQQPRIANQIRALLLAGIRAATLWRQLGGNRLQLLLARKKLIASAEQQLYLLRKTLH